MRAATPCLALLLLAVEGPGVGAAATAALPDFFGAYVEAGDRLYELSSARTYAGPGEGGSRELQGIGPVTVAPAPPRFLVYTGGATDLMEIPVHRLERVGQEVDPRTGAVAPLAEVWYTHPSRAALRVAPVAARPGLLVRGEPVAPLRPGYWALEVKGRLFPFALGEHPERAAGCLRRLGPGNYEACRPASLPPPSTPPRRRTALQSVGISLWKFVSGVGNDIWETAVVRSTVGLGVLLGAYSFVYWLILKVKGTYFLQVAPFRVWKKDAEPYLSEGLAARVADELRRLQLDIRDHGAPAGAAVADLRLHELSQPPPAAAQVTIEFKGMSPDALNGFLRRRLRRYDLIMGDLFPGTDGSRLLGRSSGGDAWEVKGPKAFDGAELDDALRAFAVRAVVAVRPQSDRALANALAYRQGEAFDAHDHGEALRLARLGLLALPDEAAQHYNAGVAYQNLDLHDEAIVAYGEAIRREPKMAAAYNNRANAYIRKRELELAQRDLRKVLELRPGSQEVLDALKLIETRGGGSAAGDRTARINDAGRERAVHERPTSDGAENGRD